MLLSPLTLPETNARPRPVAKRPVARAPERGAGRAERPTPMAAALVAWLAIGACAWLLVPAARGDARLGATLPFWLLAAPAIGLAWATRMRWTAALLDACRRHRFAARVQARRRPARSRRQTALRPAA